ncbi:PAAR domain-containing protein [Photorhabdus heterorhabditis]|uniref:PAAR domain-containing protein n=1 Tax=Photorhabdus heterorhabditis TaxID=880156 RepID=UPI00156267FB|nr:PAAR domain-containing protein [Photorhabdus heterorhabditis]NRN29729.1 PAAR domain-containing protein [Photorhabdus heterorhabditis subsp. aluminescens]
MLKNIVRQGDKTSHGGSVLIGDEYFQILGRGVARINDPVSCPKCGGYQIIVEGASNAVGTNQQGLALEGMKTSCGATLVASQTRCQIKIM